jgi:uncharacterized protein (DUF488 family)
VEAANICSMTLLAPRDPPLYTIGHSNHSVEFFLALLERYGIATLVDARSQPYSQYSPQFNHATLERVLEAAGLEYVFAGDSLGGRPRDRSHYDADGRALYFKMAAGEEFRDGLARLRFLAEERGPVALLCSEEDPTNCHRRLLIGRVLAEEGGTILHIRGDGRLQEESSLGGVRKASSLAQRGLFDETEDSSWKSIQSVSPARQRSSSSSH